MAKATIPAAKKLSGGQCKNKSGHKQTQSPDRALKKKSRTFKHPAQIQQKGSSPRRSATTSSHFKSFETRGRAIKKPLLRHIQYDKTKPVEK